MSKWDKYPVTNEEILKLLEQINPENKQDILSEIVMKLSYLVHSKIKNHNGKYFYDDLLQEGRLGIIKAVEDFNPERGKNFFKLAVWHIQTKIRRFIDKEIKQGLIKEEKNETFSLEEDINKIEISLVVSNLIDSLPLRDRIIIRNRFGMNSKKRTLEDIGLFLNISKERVRQIEEKVLVDMKNNKHIKDLYYK